MQWSCASAAIATCLLGLTACGGSGRAAWPLPNLDLASTRALTSSGIDRDNVGSLRVAWRFRFRIPPGESGAFTATPVVADGVVYLQDMRSNVYALDLKTGKLLWRRLFAAANPGPNGLAVDGGRVYGATDASAFALEAATGRPLWRRFLVTQSARYVDIAPQVANGFVYVSTIGLPPNGRGFLFALDARTGSIRWRWSTIAGAWRIPGEAGGGGAWETPSVADGHVYWVTSNPYPYGGSRAHPNGGAYAGAALYTDSLVALDAKTGKLAWYDQVTRHDVRDYDFQLPPVLGSAGGHDAVFGAGKAGLVVVSAAEANRRSGIVLHDPDGAATNPASSPVPGIRFPVRPLAPPGAVHAAGHRYRLYRKDLPGRPDLVFPRYKLAVFVHGCF